MIVKLNNEGMGVRSISRVLDIPKTTVSRILLSVSQKLKAPIFTEQGHEYEVDELRTFFGSKKNECWICYAINRKTKRIIDFIVGRRTKENIAKVVRRVLSLSPTKIYTDRLNIYPGLIPKKLHFTQFRQTNHIERMNLTLRTHLKRLSYKTICYSKSIAMLTACLKIYFWS
ncbi:MAG TPA: IS1 family transposase [Cryomorphaceae bacterium]|nr:transposase [Owenweeksia sp.]HAD97189.1 IS1 family transposase [Cryomorphaceae bacterium]|tara:strand:- start:4072 stop:4587 length:516 start_codon:yes stop_codon:yes gene_type:complete